MPTSLAWPDPSRPVRTIAFTVVLALCFTLACSEDKPGAEPPPGEAEPFESVEAVVNAPGTFSAPRVGAPLADGSIVLIATAEGASAVDAPEFGERVAILKQTPGSAEPELLYSGDALVNPLDLAVSLDEKTLYIADPAGGLDGNGAISTLAVAGGEPTPILGGYAPRAVTVAGDGRVYFSGVSGESGEPGVFELSDGVARSLFEGAPLVDPSGIAVDAHGVLFIADTRLFDRTESVGSEAGIVRVQAGQASIIASGFATGYPAGVALTRDEKTLVVSGEGADRSDTVFLVDLANPGVSPRAVTGEFSRYQDASAGLKRAHSDDTFIWASLAANGGTVFRIVAN
jgi:DNA-binding beta-propeller fold protein YncE